ncbi:SusC/RagA family TonB-linked outer membrane protein [Chitinophaga rhizophila]|nr:SusC/RagA family TonB-linked outer membrane protein [Chitinophaga rhizophila]
MGSRAALLLLLPAMGYAASDNIRHHPQQQLLAATGLNQSAAGKQTLKDILVSLETRYKVRINYVGQAIGNMQAEPPSAKGSAVKFIQYLNQYLKPLGLEAEEAGSNLFIIYKQEGAAPVQRSAAATEGRQAAEQARPAVITVSGSVTDDTGVPLPGVTVVVKGTSNGVHTSNDGKYELRNVPENAHILFSFIGYKSQEITLKGQAKLDVRLKTDVQAVKDVVVTGYYEIKKESFTGIATVLTSDDIKRVNPQNILSSLQAYDPSFKLVENNLLGSNPNRIPNINVRGTTALPSADVSKLTRNSMLTGVTNQPTFILDGYEVNAQTVFDLDPNRIASMTLLKDAAATAIYGSRAANGVVVIRTKAPKEGKLAVNYGYEMTMNAPDLSDYQVLNAAEKLEYERLAKLYEANNVDAPMDLEKLYYQKKKNVLSGVNTYWLSQPLQVDLGHKHSIYLEGGTPVVKYGLDVRYQSNNGVMKGSYRKRYGLAASLSYNVQNKIQFRNQMSITQVDGRESPYREFSRYVRMNPYYPKTDSTGRLLREVDKWSYRTGAESRTQTDAVLNPMYEATLGSLEKNDYVEFMDAFSGEWTINPALRLRGQISLTKRKATADKFVSPFSNEYYTVTGNDMKDRGMYTYSDEDFWQADGSLTLSYAKQIRSNFLNISLGTNIQDRSNDMKTFKAQGFSNDRFSQIEFARIYERDKSPEGDFAQDRLIGSFLYANYSYKNKILMDGTVRLDGSSKFGTDSRMATFWSYGLGWNVHNEKFIPRKVISQLTLRATTGLTGDVSFPAYLSNTTYQYYSNDWYSTGVGAIFRTYGNASLRWQRTKNYDAGMELDLFNGRFYIAPRYYYKLTKDLLADIIVPPSAGFTDYKANLGEMVNRGFEVNVRSNVLRGKNWSFNLFANFVTNKNKITKISNALKSYNDKVDDKQQNDPELNSVPLLRFQEGQSLNTIYAVKSMGIDPETGKEIFMKKDGTYTHTYSVKDMVPVGDMTTRIEGTFGGSLYYGNWVAEVRFYAKGGGDLYNQTLVDRVENADPRYNVDRRVLESRWKQPGDKALYKDIADQGSTRTSSRFVQRDNVVELKSVYLAYNLPMEIAKRYRMNNLRCAVNMNDIWRTSSIQAERGIDYPFARTFTFSLSTQF